MTFLRKFQYSSVGLNFFVAAFCIQWYPIVDGLWTALATAVVPLSVVKAAHPELTISSSGFYNLSQLFTIDLFKLLCADFSAAAVLITFGGVLGRVNPAQLLFIAFIEIIAYSLNEHLSWYVGAMDVGGSMVIHAFGAIFGLACSRAMTRKRHAKDTYSQFNSASYSSDVMAMIGTIFLFIFWPSFNAALAGTDTTKAVTNTLFSIVGSCISAFFGSYVFRSEKKKFNMVDIQNATLAGGVGIINLIKLWALVQI
jgi:ammonium transporter Rh